VHLSAPQIISDCSGSTYQLVQEHPHSGQHEQTEQLHTVYFILNITYKHDIYSAVLVSLLRIPNFKGNCATRPSLLNGV